MTTVPSASSSSATTMTSSFESLTNGTAANGHSQHSQDADEHMTEEEAALYDRQLRLWGSVAQSRIRQCRILIAPFQGGVAIETAKNLILAGVKEVILLDDGVVDGYSLTAGFVWREDDVGKKRIEAARSRLSSLNPHVTITTIVKPPTLDSITPFLTSTDKPLSALVYTNSNPFSPCSLSQSSLCTLNDSCRSANVRFHVSSSQGLDGWIYQDLGKEHQFLVERRSTHRDEKNAAVEKTWTELQGQQFVTLADVCRLPWKQASKAATKRSLKGSESLWGTRAIWKLQEQEDIRGPQDVLPSTLLATVEELLKSDQVDPQLLWEAEGVDSQQWAETFLTNALPVHPTQPADFAPTTAVLGGILSQEILNSVGGREAPKVSNWLVFYGLKGQAPVFSLGGLGNPYAKIEGSAAEVKTDAP